MKSTIELIREGRESFRIGNFCCPYPSGSAANTAWNMGFQEAYLDSRMNMPRGRCCEHSVGDDF